MNPEDMMKDNVELAMEENKVHLTLMGQRWVGGLRVTVRDEGPYYGTKANIYRIAEHRHRVIYWDGTWQDCDDESCFIKRPRGKIKGGSKEDKEVDELSILFQRSQIK